MFTKTLSAAALALIASNLVSAQTFTDCDPTKTDCRPDPAFGSRKAECDFTKGKCDVFETLPGTTLSYNENGAVFAIEKETNAPTVETGRYMFFGRLDVEVQPALGQGIVTSIVLESDDLDEVDWEWVGGDNYNVQSNYFSKGDTTTYDRGGKHAVENALTTMHTYSLDWTPERLQWIINGEVVRELTYEDAKGGSTYPQSPMQIKLGSWVAGRKDAPKGTVEWAGGYTDFSKAPFNAYYKSVKITDYAGTSKPATGDIKEYVYGDRSGTWQSIKVIKGDGSSDDDDHKTTTKAPTKTKTSESSTKTKTSETEEETETKTKTVESTATTMVTVSSTTEAATTTAEESTTAPAESTESTTTVPEGAAGANAVSMAVLVFAGAGALAALI